MNSASHLDTQGFVLIPNVLDAAACQSLVALLGDANGAGTRGMLHIHEVASLARSV